MVTGYQIAKTDFRSTIVNWEGDKMEFKVPALTRLGIVIIIIMMISAASLLGQDITVGLQQYDSTSYDGYTLLAPLQSNMTYLIDNYGRVVHTWESNHSPGMSAYLLEDGSILRAVSYFSTLGTGGGVQEISWDNHLIWDYQCLGENYTQHHDVEKLPNGNVLILAMEYIPRTEAINAGRDPSMLTDSTLWSEYVIEVEPTGPTTGDIVWEWHVKDHLIQDFDPTKDNYGVVADHPELIDINYARDASSDWLHANSVDYNPEFDQVVISVRHFCEFWIIDHSTTTAEASGHAGGIRGHGGDIIYRWGNPQSYGRGDSTNKKFFDQHDACWIEPDLPGAGEIMIFNNGVYRPGGDYSSVDAVVPDVDSSGNYPWPSSGNAFGPADEAWTYSADPPNSFYSRIISGAQRLPNGNTLICSGKTGRLFEIDTNDSIVWEYINPVTNYGPMPQGGSIAGDNSVFRCYRYSANYAGLQGHDLRPGGPIEIYPIKISGTFNSPDMPTESDSVLVTAEIVPDDDLAFVELYYDDGSGYSAIPMYDDGNHHDDSPDDGLYGATIPPIRQEISVNYYLRAEDITGAVVHDPSIAPDAAYRYQILPFPYICGDANGDESINVSDAVYIINYVFVGGGAPDPLESADANCDSSVNVSDAVFIINFVFVGGNPPCDVDGDEIPDC